MTVHKAGHPESSAHPERQWRQARQKDLLERHVPGTLLAVAVVESILAVRNVVVLTGTARLVLPTLQTVIVILALAGWWRLRRQQVDPEEVQRWIGSGLVGLGLLLPLEQALTGHGLLAANLGIILVAAGGVLISHRVFFGALVFLVLAWMAAVASRTGWDIGVGEQTTLVAIAIIVALLVHWNRTNDRAALVSKLSHAWESGLRDELTGLWNRRGGRDVWGLLAAGAERDRVDMWCVFLDVRGLKRVNDEFGHDKGDELLTGVATAVAAVIPPGVVAARWGGDEFCLFGSGRPPEIEVLAGNVRRAAAASVAVDCPWDISPGVSTLRADTSDAAFWRLVGLADQDMYRRRRTGGAADRMSES